MQPSVIASKRANIPAFQPASAAHPSQKTTANRSDFRTHLLNGDTGGPAQASPASQTARSNGPLRSNPCRGAPVPGRASSTAQTSAPCPLRQQLEKLLGNEARVEKHLKKTLRRGVSSMEELLDIQLDVYRYVQHVDLMSKVVDRVNGALQQTLQTRV